MRPVVKVEDGVGGAVADEGLQPEADAGQPWQRRRLSEAGAAVSDEALSRRAYLEAGALAVEGMERTRVLGEELLQAKALIARLEAEVRIKDGIIQSKDVIIQSKDDQLLLAKDAQLAALAAAHHVVSHAFLSEMLSEMLIDSRPGVAQDAKRAFKFAKAAAALGCAHSKGALGCCYLWGFGVAASVK